MDFKNFNTISNDVRIQINMVRDIWSANLGSNFMGMYIHGSMALECFQENVSDIDILMICKHRLTRCQRISIAKAIVDIDLKPCPLELSAIWIDDLNPWNYPTKCQFHYSDYWTEQYMQIFEDSTKECSILDNDFEDADIACHIKLTKQCGIRVCGDDINAIFPDVPEEDFWNSISDDIDNYNFNAYKPKYFASNILILGRILSYKKQRRIISKYAGGLWAMDYVPKQYRYIIEDAMHVWFEDKKSCNCNSDDLTGLRDFLISEIKS